MFSYQRIHLGLILAASLNSLFRPRTAQLARSPFAHARAGASQRAPTQRLRSVHTTHGAVMAFPCACDSDSLSCTCRRLRHRRSETLLCGRHRFHYSLSMIRHQRQLTRIRSLSRRTRRAVAARVFAHLLGAERERRPPSCSFRCHLDAARSWLSMLRRLSRSQLQGSLRRAAKARRSRTSAVSDRRADGKLAISRRHPPLAAVFATRPPPASWAGSPRTRAAPRPELTADGWPARVSRGWVRLGLGFPVEERW